MRRFARIATLGLVLALGCGSTPDGARPFAPLKVPEKTLAIAFDDIPSQAAVTAPMSLTASDGTGLKLVALQGRAVIDDPLAFTELHLTFENPNDRVLEGTFSIVLPQGAAISRFAMKNDLGFQEGEVVEKQQARVAYEDSLHRRQDPALLEQAGGNEFTARVFPIPARAKKELIVSFSQELSKRRPYVLPLKGLPEIGAIDVQAFVTGKAAPVLAIQKQGLKPEGDLRVDPGLLGDRAGVRNGNLVLARVTPIVGSQPEPLGATLLLVDTSASRALGMVEQGRILKQIVAGIARSSGAKTKVLVAAYDQAVEPVFAGGAGEMGDDAITRMRQRLALGASNLDAALAWAGDQASTHGLTRVVLVTDGVPTAGETSGDKLRQRVVSLQKKGVERLDAIALGGIRDDDLLKSLVNAGLPHGGVVVDTSMDEEDQWRRLNQATRSGVSVNVENAVFTFPSTIDGVQAGDEVLVYANVPEDKPVRISIGGDPFTSPDLAKVERPLLERAWVGAKIKSLVEKERVEGASPALSREIVGLSTKHRVLSSKTALLVLETDWDYQRFGIDRTALADILVTEGSRISLLHRATPAPPKPPPPPVVVATKPTDTKWKGSTSLPKSAPAKKPAGPVGDVTTVGHGAGTGPGTSRSTGKGASAGGGWAPPSTAAPREFEKADREDEKVVSAPRGAVAPMATAAPAATATSPSRVMAAPNDPLVADPSSSRSEPAPVNRAPVRPPSEPRREQAGSGYVFDEGSVDGTPDGAANGVVAEPSVTLPEAAPYTGNFKVVMDLIARHQIEQAIRAAFEWRKSDPGDVMALIALGEGFEAAGDLLQAARCYGSLVDLFSARADLRRFAGERLERLKLASALDLAADTYAKAEVERPDHPASHRLLAFALLKQHKPAEAFEAIVRGLRQSYPPGRFAGVTRILSEDLGLIGAAWIQADPARATDIRGRIGREGGAIEDEPSIRFVLNWETDANDVDFHIHDSKGGHAFYSQPDLRSGGSLYADVTTGYGPECFTIRGRPEKLAFPYHLQAHYYSRGPMGYGMGKLQILRHDGKGTITFEERPFVVMIDRAFVDLGTVDVGAVAPAKVAR